MSVALGACGGSSSHASSSATGTGAAVSPTPGQLNGHNDSMQSFFTPGPQELAANPAATLETVKALGADRAVVFLNWSVVAPHATSSRKPAFDATDPAAYPASGWATYDAIFREAAQLKLKLDVILTGSPPLWASGPGALGGPASAHPYWEPNAQDFEQFVEAVGKRYSGHYTPKGAHGPLPRIDFWSLWNEPNLGTSIAPQTLASVNPIKGGTTIEVAPAYYRQLADAAWTGLHKTGHGSDTTLIDNLAPLGTVGKIFPGNYAVMTPIRFLRALYCVGSDYKPLTGQAATERQCPATPAASKRFRAENPVLFDATDVATHPYSYAQAPDAKVPGQPDDAELANLPTFFAALDKTQRAYGSARRFDVYDTEYGYQTDPPNVQAGNLRPATAAVWDNWGEYLHWKTPRLLSYDQYQLADPAPIPHKAYTRFSSGLRTYAGVDKPGYAAYRLGIFLPMTTGSSGAKLEVWGAVRPAKLEPMAKRPPAAIQFRPASGGAWKTLEQVSSRTPEGYFDVMQSFPGSGSVRLRWKYPGAGFIESRTVRITLH